MPVFDRTIYILIMVLAVWISLLVIASVLLHAFGDEPVLARLRVSDKMTPAIDRMIAVAAILFMIIAVIFFTRNLPAYVSELANR